MKTLYSYAIKTDGEKTYLTDNLNRQKLPLAAIFADGEKEPRYAAFLLRDLAQFALEQAEIIEDMEGIRPIPKRELFAEYRAEIVPVMPEQNKTSKRSNYTKDTYRTVSPEQFAQLNEWSISNDELLTMAEEHEKDANSREWIEAYLTECNFHAERKLLHNGKYEELRNTIEPPLF